MYHRQFGPLLREYVSEIDDFLMQFDKRSEAQSPNRQREEDKYRDVHAKRDSASEPRVRSRVWEDF